jgi:acyl-CoA synthetase (NDP forming)/RimJ/RimL family protein N-acetyltransferase
MVTAPAPGVVAIALRDGSTVTVRRVTAADRGALAAFLDALGVDARYLRFFSCAVDVEREAAAAAGLGLNGQGLIALAGDPERIVGHAEYIRERPGRAEVAFEVAGAWQGHGIATVLLAQLAELASEQGIDTFTATVLPANHRMIGVFRDSGFATEVSVACGELQVEFPTALSRAGRVCFEDRSATASAAAVAHVLHPESVVVVGASARPATPGGAVLANLTAAGFRGRLAAVDAREDPVLDVPVYRSVGEVPWPIELAVVAARHSAVLGVARDCGAAGVRALVVLTAGFADTGLDGRAAQDELLRICREHGMRLVGPNSLGVLTSDPSVRLDATIVGVSPPPGCIGFASHHRADGIAALAEATRRGIGLSSFVSTGNKADLSGNDLLEYWERDPATHVVLLHLESFGNPRRFGRIARRLSRRKPIVAVKRTRGSTDDALFAHAGVVRTDTVEESLDVAALLAGQPLPRGERVALVEDPDAAGLEALAADPQVEAVIACFGPAVADAAALIRSATSALRSAGKPLAVVLAAGSGAPRRLGEGVPVFATRDGAARALAHAGAYARWRATADEEPVVLPGADTDAVAALVAARLHAGAGWLTPGDVDALLACVGLRPGGAACVEIVSDPDFGPVVSCHAGGRTAARLAPLTRRDAGEMARELGHPSGLEDLLLRLAALAAARPEIAEIACDAVTGTRIRLATPPRPRPSAALDR